MEALFNSIPNLKLRAQIRGDDIVDQINHFVTVSLLAFAGFLIGLKEFVGDPLDCWVNISNFQHFQGHVNSYCWANRMYKYPNSTDYGQLPYKIQPGMPGPGEEVTSHEDLGEINFYRWVTVVFFIQAILFKLPALIWSELNEISGTQIEKMVSMVTESTFKETENRKAVFATLAEFIEIWLKINRKPFKFMTTKIGRRARKILRYCMLCVGGNTGNYLSTMYLVVKFLFLFNLFMQFVILTSFLGFNYWDYGPDALDSFSSGVQSENFPRVGLCHFQLLKQGYWIQCMLSINMILEIIFLVEWYWLLLLLIITIINFGCWILKTLQTHLSIGFVMRYLAYFIPEGTLRKEGAKTVDIFVMDYLGNDGVFLLRILATNANDVAMAELVHGVWNRFLQYGNVEVVTSRELKRDASLADFKGTHDGAILEIDRKYTD